MGSLLTLAKSLGIDPGPLNQAELQEQTCSAAMKQIIELAAQVERLRCLLESAIRGEEIIVGDAIVIGIDAELADEIEDSFDESPKAALTALKAQWQAEVVDRCEKEVTASVNVLLKPHIAGVFAVIRHRAQEAVDEN